MPEAISISKEEFVIRAIKKLRDPSKSQGIHCVLSGFNQAFKLKFGEEARATTDKMAAEGKIIVVPARRGVRLYLPEEAPLTADPGAVLDKIMT